MPARVHYRNRGRGTWEVRIYRDGRELRRSFGSGEGAEENARRYADAQNAATPATDATLRVDDALEAWLATWRPALSRSYEATARTLIRRHLAPFFGDRLLVDVEAADAGRFAERMQARGLSASTTRGALSLLRRVLTLNVEAGVLDRNVFANVGRVLRGVARRQAREVARVDAWTAREVATLLAIAGRQAPWLHGLLVFLTATGVRRGEALGLRWQDVDLARGVVLVRRSRVRGEESTTKTGAAREVPLDLSSLPVREVLEELRRRRGRPDELVFRSPRRLALQERNVSRAWYGVRDQAVAGGGCRALRLHDFRHTFASHALEAGWSIRRVASWLGHSSPETTWRVYAHVVADGELLIRPAPRLARDRGWAPDESAALPPRGPVNVRPAPVRKGERCA